MYYATAFVEYPENCLKTKEFYYSDVLFNTEKEAVGALVKYFNGLHFTVYYDDRWYESFEVKIMDNLNIESYSDFQKMFHVCVSDHGRDFYKAEMTGDVDTVEKLNRAVEMIRGIVDCQDGYNDVLDFIPKVVQIRNPCSS